MMTLLERVTRFFEAGWKEQGTCLTLVRELQEHIYTYPSGSVERQELQKKTNRLQALYSEIGRLTRGTNPSVVYEGTPLLPCVAWIPQPILDEETGITTIPAMPDIPEFESKEERCYYLKSLADAALENNNAVVAEPVPSPTPEPTSEPAPKPTSEPTPEPTHEDVVTNEAEESSELSSAQVAINAIRSRRRRKQPDNS